MNSFTISDSLYLSLPPYLTVMLYVPWFSLMFIVAVPSSSTVAVYVLFAIVNVTFVPLARALPSLSRNLAVYIALL